MMKTLKNTTFQIGLVLVTLFLAFSCDLNEVNPSGATADEVWNSPEGILTVVNAAYSDQRQLYGKVDGPFIYEVGTDLWFNKGLDGYARQLSKYEGFTPSSGNPNKKGWSVPWKGVNLCNAGINRIDDAGFQDEQEKNERLAELRFLRAFYYWHIVESYGGVMLRIEETKEPMLTARRSSVESFYDLIIDDLTFAKDHLPLDQGNEYSRASKKSALGFLARAYLSRAYYGASNEYFGLAKNICDSIILKQAELGVALWDSYAELWDPDHNADGNRGNKEALYTVSNSENTNLNFDGNANRLHRWYMMRYDNFPGLEMDLTYGESGGRRFAPTLQLLDYYDETMDARYQGSFREVWLANTEFVWSDRDSANYLVDVSTYDKSASLIGDTVHVGDTALYITKQSVAGEALLPYVVFDRDTVYATGANNALTTGQDYVQLKKFEDPSRATAAQRYSYHDIFVMRFAEVYLIAAEAEVQLGNLASAAEYVNVLRTRAAIKEPVDRTDEMQVAADEMNIEFILAERARELAGEHMRWFDLKRVFQNEPSQFVNYITTRNPNITELREHHILRPVPQEDMDLLLNREEFGQNPGYN